MGGTINAQRQTAGDGKTGIGQILTPLPGIGRAVSGHAPTTDYGYLREMQAIYIAANIEQGRSSIDLPELGRVIGAGDTDNDCRAMLRGRDYFFNL